MKGFSLDFARKIKSAFEGVDAVHDEAKTIMREAQELQRLWDVGLEEAVRNGREHGVDSHEDVPPLTSAELFSLCSNVGTSYDVQIKQYFDGRMNRDRAIAVNNSLQWSGVRGDYIFMPQSVITKGMRSKDNTSRSAHNLTRNDFFTLERDINSAEVIVYNKKADTFLVLKARENANPTAYAIHFEHNNGEFARLRQ